MKKKVTIIDYNLSNLRSVDMAIRYCGAEAIITNSPNKIIEADYLLLPGVGAFTNGMAEFEKKGLVEPVKKFAESGRPFLGICLGMQMLFDYSEEFSTTGGLGLIHGRIANIPKTTSDGIPHKIPHIGWNSLKIPSNNCDWGNTILGNINPMTMLYFVHSYTAIPANDKNRLADCDYNGRLLSAAVKKDNLYGCQFHPEKSGEVGLKIIQNFLAL